MSAQWRKVVGDFRQHRREILIVSLVLFLGTTGVVAALDAYAVLRREIALSYLRANSPDLALWFERVEPDMLEIARSQPGVVEVDVRRVAAAKVAGARPGAWLPLRLVVVRDFTDQRLGLVHRHGADWPSGDHGIFIEQSSLPLLPADAGGQLRVRLPGGGDTLIPIAGTVHDTAVAPGYMEGLVYAYASPAVAARLGQSAELDQLVVLMDDRSRGPTVLAGALSAAFTAAGAAPLRIEVLPNVHPHAGLMNSLLMIFQGVGTMAFAASAALATFVVSLWMRREARQVGIMKTIGAGRRHLAGQYLALVGPPVLLSGAVALLAGGAFGRAVVRYSAAEQNLDIDRWSAPPGLLALEIALALGVPLLAMAVPILRAALRPAREAIHDPGLAAPSSAGRLVTRFVGLPSSRIWTFALRNTFRRRGRLAATLAGLSLGGAILLTASNHYESLMRVIDANVSSRGHDLQAQLQRPIAIDRLETLARTLPGVAIAEAWQRTSVEILPEAPASQSPAAAAAGHNAPAEGPRVQLSGYPVGTRLPQPACSEGRWPLAGEADAVVVTRPLQRRVPGVRLGGELDLRFRQLRTRVRVVGIVDEMAAAVIYADRVTYGRVTGVSGVASELRIQAVDRVHLDPVVAAVDQALLDERLAFSPILTRWDVRRGYDEHFREFVAVCATVALLVASVGALCLVAFACLGVVERTREVGVIRTLGATPRQVAAIFVVECGATAALGLLLAVAVSLPATRAFNSFTSNFAMLVPLPFTVSWPALAVLIAGLPLVLLAAWVCVSRLLRRPVREALAYE